MEIKQEDDAELCEMQEADIRDELGRKIDGKK